MKLSKHAKQLVEDLDLSEVDAYMMELKSQLYDRSAELIANSDLTHEQIAKEVGTSRARITRIANMGENSVSIGLLIKITTVITEAPVLKFIL